MHGLQKGLWELVWWDPDNKFKYTYLSCDGDIHNFCLMLRKGVFMRTWIDHRSISWFTQLLADVFERSQNKCIVLYELDKTYFLSVLRLAWQGCLKTKTWTALLMDVDMLLCY